MTESYAVGEDYLGRRLRLAGRGEVEVPDTIYYPVSEDYRDGRLSDTLDWLNWLAWVARAHAGERFSGYVYMNYAAPRFVRGPDGTYRAETPRNAILFGYAVPRLLGYYGYTEVGFDRRLERLPVYQADLGEPLGEGYERQAGVYVRFYRPASSRGRPRSCCTRRRSGPADSTTFTTSGGSWPRREGSRSGSCPSPTR